MTPRRCGRLRIRGTVGAILVGGLLVGVQSPAASAGPAAPAVEPPAGVEPRSAAMVPAAAPYYPVGNYVTAVYDDLFDRAPDPTGLAGWSWALTHGAPYGAVADGITYSDEFRMRLITDAYRTYLDRAPDAAGLSWWLSAMRGGLQIQNMEAGFLASDEYYAAVGGAVQPWVTALYADVLGRAPSAAEVGAWSAVVPRQGRNFVAAGFLYSTEKLQADVAGYYRWLLHRPLDAVGRAGWVTAIQAGHRVEEIIAGIIASPEYRQNVPVITPAGPGRPDPTGVGAPLGFRLFPASDPWNTRVDGAAVDPASATLISSIGASDRLHMDFGANWDGGPFGIPYVVVGAGQPWYPVSFDYADESDPGPYPIPPDAPIEGGADSGGDRHVLVVDASTHLLYELYDAHPQADGSWHAGSGAVFNLDTGTSRPAGWTSADAAGLPILPGLVRYDEVASGHIDHAIRFTVSATRRGYIAPATHFASSSSSTSLPPMGMRVRLRADFDISGYPAQARVILAAMKTYGMIVADNGSDWYVSGAPDARWDDDQLNTLKNVPGSAFEVVAMGPVTTG